MVSLTQNGGSHIADCTAEIIVGDYTRANMVGFDAEADLGLIDAIEDGETNKAYVDRTLVHYGDTPYSTIISTGALPLCLSIDEVTGVLSGTPTEAGVFSFTVGATDNALANISKVYTINILDPAAPIVDPAISTNGLPEGVNSAVYYTTLTATAGLAPYKWSVNSLPAGLTLSADGIISGTPSVGSAGVTTPSFTVTDARGATDNKLFTLTIALAPVPPPAISTDALTNGVELAPYFCNFNINCRHKALCMVC